MRWKLGWIVTGLGMLVLLWAVLHLSAAGYGSRPRDSFANRRPYNQVKSEVHEAFPGAILRALAAGLLLWFGARLRSSTGADSERPD